MKRTPFKKVSKKQALKLAKWQAVKIVRIHYLISKYGAPVCEYCGENKSGHEFWILDGHHIDGNRNNNDPSNCYVCHRICHSWIEDHNIKVKQEGFEGRQ